MPGNYFDKYDKPASSGVQIKPADPKLPGEVAGIGLQNKKTAQQIGIDDAANKRAADANYRARIELEADLMSKGLRLNKAGALEPIPNWKPLNANAPGVDRAAELRDRVTALGNMEGGLSRLNELYNKNLKGRPFSRAFGLTEYLPDFLSPDNAEFNKVGKQMGPYIMSILGLSGKATDAAAEYKQKVMPFIPSAQSFDNVNESTLDELAKMLTRQKSATYKELGVPLPLAKPNITAKPPAKVIDFADLPE